MLRWIQPLYAKRRPAVAALSRGGWGLAGALGVWCLLLSQPTWALRFVSMGDSRGCSIGAVINETELARINRRIAALSPGADLLVFSGDCSYRGDTSTVSGEHHYTYQAWLDFMRRDLPAALPLYLVPGNHEMYDEHIGASSLSCSCQQAYQGFVTANVSDAFMSGVASLPGYENLAYSFTAAGGQVLFVVLDGFFVPEASCPSIPESEGDSLDSAQLEFLRQTLAGSQAKAKFVFVHNPAFSPTDEKYTQCTKASMCRFWQIVNDNGATAVFNGHVHLYSRVFVDDSFVNAGYDFTRSVPQVIAGTCGAPIADYTPGCDTSDEPSVIYAPASWHVKSLYNYSVVDVDLSGNTARMTVHTYCGDLDGVWSLCDQFSVPAATPAPPDLLLLGEEGGS
jgi:3',5'-cyclic AMP phosphodiesterase CpdA